MHELLHLSESEGRQLVLKSDCKNVSVPIGRILYVESVNNYVKVHLSDGTSVLSKIPLHQLEGQLPPEEFLRIHRSFIVARKRVCRFSNTEVIL